VNQAQFEVVVTAGSLRPEPGNGVVMPHRWTAEGVVFQADFTGAHLFLLAAAGCVLNDVYREAATLDIEIDGVRVCAEGGFDSVTWASTGIEYDVDVASDASNSDIEHLVCIVDDVAEIPKALRSATRVARRSKPPSSAT
jgi:uncharacterized OsmC-like protein